MKLNKIQRFILLGYGVAIIILSVFWVPQRCMVPQASNRPRAVRSDPDLIEVVEYHPIWHSISETDTYYRYSKGVAFSSLAAEMLGLTLIAGVAFVLTKGMKEPKLRNLFFGND